MAEIFLLGWVGVDYFFVLSGFIIYHVNSRSIGRSEHLGRYIFKRFVRLFPIYWLYTAFVWVAALLIKTIAAKDIISWTSFSSEALISSLLVLPSTTLPILPVAWTLTYEVLFYAAFALLFITISNQRTRFVLCALWLLAIFLGYTSLLPTAPKGTWFSIASDTRILEFFAGGVAAYLLPLVASYFPQRKAVLLSIIAFSLLLVVLAIEHSQKGIIQASGYTMLVVPLGLLVLAMALEDFSRPAGPHGRLRLAMCYVGDASYSIYLIHFHVVMVVAFITNRFHIIKAGGFIVATVASIIVGCLAYTYIEKPLLSKISR